MNLSRLLSALWLRDSYFFFYSLRLHTLKSKGGGHDKHFVFEVNENKISLSNLCLVSMLRLWEYILHSFTIFLGLKTVYFYNVSTLRTRLEFWFKFNQNIILLNLCLVTMGPLCKYEFPHTFFGFENWFSLSWKAQIFPFLIIKSQISI